MDKVSHEGHRKHLRQAFLSTGLDAMPDHQVLELLLTYGIPRVDVNPVAHLLMDKFGSLAGVLDAPVEELTEIPHVSENVAVLIKMISPMYQRYSASRWKKKPVLNNGKCIAEFLVPYFYGKNEESLVALSLDTHYRLNTVERLSSGTLDKASIEKRTIMSFVYRTRAKYVILAHNHPSGEVDPSLADIRMTEVLMQALLAMDVVLLDHVIIAGEKSYSFLSHGIIQYGDPEEEIAASDKGDKT